MTESKKKQRFHTSMATAVFTSQDQIEAARRQSWSVGDKLLVHGFVIKTKSSLAFAYLKNTMENHLTFGRTFPELEALLH